MTGHIPTAALDAHTGVMLDRLAEAANITAGYPPRWSMDDTYHSGGRLNENRDSGILWAGRLAAAIGLPSFRLVQSPAHWDNHLASAEDWGAVSKLRWSDARWVPIQRMLAACEARPAVMRLSILKAPWSEEMSRWAAWDGNELLIAGTKLRDPRPSDTWRAGYGVRVEDIDLTRAYLEEVGYFI